MHCIQKHLEPYTLAGLEPTISLEPISISELGKLYIHLLARSELAVKKVNPVKSRLVHKLGAVSKLHKKRP
jgi:hypothetical protein